MEGTRVLVTGGAGVIGRQLVRRLEELGATLMVGDLKPRPQSFSRDVIYRAGDLITVRKDEIDDFSPEVVFHLAATFERSTETLGFWEENFHHNIHLSHHLMTVLPQVSSVRRVVFASSYLVYDPAIYLSNSRVSEPVRLDEQARLCPRNLTGMAKLLHENELKFLRSFDEIRFSSMSARIFRGYGVGSRDVISRWVRALSRNEAISVFNRDGRFDYIFARDSAEGLIRLAQTESLEPVVNLGSGRSRTVEEVVNILVKHFPSAKINFLPDRGELEASESDNSLLESITQWSPRITLEQGIEEIVAWHSDERNG